MRFGYIIHQTIANRAALQDIYLVPKGWFWFPCIFFFFFWWLLPLHLWSTWLKNFIKDKTRIHDFMFHSFKLERLQSTSSQGTLRIALCHEYEQLIQVSANKKSWTRGCFYICYTLHYILKRITLLICLKYVPLCFFSS